MSDFINRSFSLLAVAFFFYTLYNPEHFNLGLFVMLTSISNNQLTIIRNQEKK